MHRVRRRSAPRHADASLWRSQALLLAGKQGREGQLLDALQTLRLCRIYTKSNPFMVDVPEAKRSVSSPACCSKLTNRLGSG